MKRDFSSHLLYLLGEIAYFEALLWKREIKLEGPYAINNSNISFIIAKKKPGV